MFELERLQHDGELISLYENDSFNAAAYIQLIINDLFGMIWEETMANAKHKTTRAKWPQKHQMSSPILLLMHIIICAWPQGSMMKSALAGNMLIRVIHAHFWVRP